MSPPEGGGRKVVAIGNYRFTGRLLGRGNFARVEEAVHNVLNVRVAVKIMDVNEIKEDYVVKHLYREAKLMAKLNHPCIAALYQTMQRSDNVYYLVTELAAGGDLCTFIKNQKHGKLNESTTRYYARQFVSALAHMHNVGVVHRDLKMENVMLNLEHTQIKIVDFGLSNIYHPDEPLRTHCGSPEYAAPELFVTGKKYGPEVDLWSFGIILYGMVIGQLPFISNRSEQISSQERRKKLVSQISRGLGSAHRRLLALFSQEFRCMMNRMLVADARKRIGIKELLVHPWITEKGKRIIKPNPVKKLEIRDSTKLMSDIADILQLPVDEVATSIRNEPFSKIGGIYNILAHTFSINKLSGDGISRAVPPLNIENFSRKLDISNKDVSHSHRITTSKYLTMSGNDSINKSKLPVSIQARKSDNTNQSKIRPRTVQPMINREQDLVDYRTIKSPTLRRKAYSASLSSQNRPSTVSAITNKLPKVIDLSKPDVAKPASRGRGLVNGVNTLKKVSKGPKQEEDERVRSATERKLRYRPDKMTSLTRPATTNEATTNLRRYPDISSLNAGERINPRIIRATTTYETMPFEMSPFAFGDNDVGDTRKKVQKLKKPTIYDPIARCIAGYVVNNVPKKLPF
ncbi:uncharacterized protein LOC143205359 isoform X1 [Rhynchophorus ferrugineus]|uniref:uncharacterized protein LOC143205359 isoform X1 n=1 Tax=Rhynchophorus ferrugineus TaxID=354439 RepID=UPI003FCCD065